MLAEAVTNLSRYLFLQKINQIIFFITLRIFAVPIPFKKNLAECIILLARRIGRAQGLCSEVVVNY